MLELNGPDKINIYPNPTKENVYVSNLKEDNVDLKIYDINGKIVMQQKISNKEYLNVSKLSNGIYQLTFEGKNWKENRKLIKE